MIIEGMSCEHCVAHVKEALTPLAEGEVEVSLKGKYAILETKITNDLLSKALDDAGYDVEDIQEIEG